MSAFWVYKKKVHKPTELTVHKTFTLSLSNTVHCLANSPLKTLMVNSHISRLLATLHFMPIIIKGKTSRTGIHLARKESSNAHFFLLLFLICINLDSDGTLIIFLCLIIKHKKIISVPSESKLMQIKNMYMYVLQRVQIKAYFKTIPTLSAKNCWDIFVLRKGNFREHTVHTSPPSTNQSWGVCCFYR